MIYDITSLKQAIETLMKLFNIDEDTINKIVVEQGIHDVDRFLSKIDRSLLDFDLDEMEVVGIHSTTNLDACESIKKTGLINMKQALSCDSSLNQFLHQNGIFIDIYTKKITYKDNSYNLVDQGNYKLHYKIFGDYQLDCFLAVSKNRPYDDALRARPKVLSEIEKFIQLAGLHQQWTQQSKPYMIKFKDQTRAFNPYSFSADGSELGVKVALVYYALMVIYTNQKIDIQIDLASEHQVKPKNIIEITVIEK